MRPERVSELTSPLPVVNSLSCLGIRSRNAPGTTSAVNLLHSPTVSPSS
jgi:hypothetical protein